MKHLAASILLLATLSASAQTRSAKNSPSLTEAKPESVGMSGERLARIDQMLEAAISEDDIPGAVALVARKGKIVYWKAFGSADVETGRKFKRDDIFRIASQTKAITSTAVMTLWERGLFRLDDPISKWIPEFKNPQVLKDFHYGDTTYTTVPASRQVTVRDLITHSSGVGYGVIDGDERFRMIYEKAGITDLYTTEDITIEESVRKLAALPLHHNPGEKFTYSEGLDVLGYFIEVVSGQPFDAYLRDHVLGPLGMDDTWFYLPDDKASRLVPVQHLSDDGTWTRFPVTFYDPEYPRKGAKRFFSGGAGLSSTAKDYATFLQMYLNNGELGGTRVLSRTTVQPIMDAQVHDFRIGEDYGLAFGLIDEVGAAQGGQGSDGTFEWGGYFNTQYFADPDEQLIGILMKQTQGTRSDDTGWQFRVLALAAVDD